MNRDINEVEFTIFDTETTGLDPESGDRIIEIAAIRFKGKEKISEFPGSKPGFASAGYNSIKLIDETFYDEAVLDLDINKKIYSFSINADINLKYDNSLVRVILVDENNNKYLVYEAYPLIEENSVSLTNVCEETCALDGIVPSELIVVAIFL